MPGRLWDSPGQSEAILRRLAIVLRDLPPATYLKVMAFLDDEMTETIRDAISKLGNVESVERQRAFELFNNSFQLQKEHSASEDSLHLSSSHQDVSLKLVNKNVGKADISEALNFQRQAERFQATAPSDAVSELKFLNDIENELLGALLESEHPQTVALVLASIEPSVAAVVLASLQPNLQHETMVRISRLINIPHAAFEEVAQHFKLRLQEHQSSLKQADGVDALKAIMDAMPAKSIDNLSRSQHEPIDAQKKTATRNASPLTKQSLTSERNDGDQGRASQIAANDGEEAVGQDSEWTPKMIHDYLIELSPKTFCLALSHVPTREALLVLSSMPTDVADRVIALLTRSQAKSVRRKMANIQVTSLEAAKNAKQKVAMAAVGLNHHTSLTSKSA